MICCDHDITILSYCCYFLKCKENTESINLKFLKTINVRAMLR